MQLYSDEANEQNRLVRLLQSKGGRLPQIARNVMFHISDAAYKIQLNIGRNGKRRMTNATAISARTIKSQ